jgi:hypothetical protein
MSRLRPFGTASLVVLAVAACSGCTDLLPGRAATGTVTVQPGAAALCVGDSQPFTARVLDDSGAVVASPSLLWSSSTPRVAIIDPATGMALALDTGTTQITATSGRTRSAAVTLNVPADLIAEFVPDSVVLAPGDTMTLGTRLRRASGGLAPSRAAAITPFTTGVASLTTSGFLTAIAPGRVGLSLSACGHQGGGAADVFAPPDAATGKAYLWLSGSQEVRVRVGARVIGFTRSGGAPAFQVVGPPGSTSRFFLYEDTAAMTGAGAYALDSLLTSEVTDSLPCRPPRPFATYTDQTNLARITLLLGLGGDSLHVTTFTPQAGYTAVSGRMRFRMRGEVNGALGPGGAPDTLAAVLTFSAPLVDTTGVCP